MAQGWWFACSLAADRRLVAMNSCRLADSYMDIEHTFFRVVHFVWAVRRQQLYGLTKNGSNFLTVASLHWLHFTTCCSLFQEMSIIAEQTRHVTCVMKILIKSAGIILALRHYHRQTAILIGCVGWRQLIWSNRRSGRLLLQESTWEIFESN